MESCYEKEKNQVNISDSIFLICKKEKKIRLFKNFHNGYICLGRDITGDVTSYFLLYFQLVYKGAN